MHRDRLAQDVQPDHDGRHHAQRICVDVHPRRPAGVDGRRGLLLRHLLPDHLLLRGCRADDRDDPRGVPVRPVVQVRPRHRRGWRRRALRPGRRRVRRGAEDLSFPPSV